MEKDIKKEFILIHGDCLNELEPFPENHFDSIVTDPPSGINIIDREWDDFSNREAFVDFMTIRLKRMSYYLKPGGFAVLWSYPRTCHLTMRAIENAGWEIYDVMVHCYSGTINKGRADEHGNNFRLNPNVEFWIIARNTKTHRNKYQVKGLLTGNHRDGGWVIKKNAWHIDILRNGRKKEEKTISYTLGKRLGSMVHDGNLSAFIGEKGKLFYSAKSTPHDDEENGRDLGNEHPSVKKLAIMRLLVDITSPENGIVLDPFMGSGSTGVACVDLRRKFVGIEKEKKHLEIANARIERRLKQREAGIVNFKFDVLDPETLKLKEPRKNKITWDSGTSMYPRANTRGRKRKEDKGETLPLS